MSTTVHPLKAFKYPLTSEGLRRFAAETVGGACYSDLDLFFRALATRIEGLEDSLERSRNENSRLRRETPQPTPRPDSIGPFLDFVRKRKPVPTHDLLLP